MSKKNRLPKYVAGVRVPRAIRKNGVVRAAFENPFWRDVMAKALLTVAGAAAAFLVKERQQVAHAADASVKKGRKRR